MIAWGEVYLNISWGVALVSIGGFVKNALSAMKLWLHSSFQKNLRVLDASLLIWKKGRYYLEVWENETT